MGIDIFPAPSAGGGVKSVQRGLAASAGTVTITSIDTSKSFVTVYGTASSGTVGGSATVGAQNGTVNAMSGNINARNVAYGGGTTYNVSFANAPYNGGNFGTLSAAGKNYNAPSTSLNAQSLSGGTNNLVAAVVQGYLSNSTSLVVSGACRWEVVEFA